ncbi:hypothetical protein [Nocardia arthritidis]|uniref:Uncharacterized protein n=1 Tax=Nocardia arthritidis TaxID=228602 RepID=A0A6G9Y627_9NOCA|nr:hypothetical protein [Nocardia arthritidis]QIS08661.1 hypothetical protein F5544_03735 [Nocardia arthritidis]
MDLKAERSRWDYLKGEAEAGRLFLDPDVASSCRDACNKQIELYQDLLRATDLLRNVTGFGRFDCADELAKMLSAKAVGGDGDVDSALRAHIEVVTLIRDTMEKAVNKIVQVDTDNSQKFEGIQPELPH